MEHLFTGDAIIALISLTVMEIILGIDNIIFISIITGKLPVVSQTKEEIRAYCWPWLLE